MHANDTHAGPVKPWQGGRITGTYAPNATPAEGYTPLPVDEYGMEIVESDYVATQSGNGMTLKCKAQIVGGEFDGRPFYINYDLENANKEREHKAQRDFAGLRRATGVLAPEWSTELHFREFRVVIGQRRNARTGELKNNISRYLWEVSGDESEALRHDAAA